MNAQQHFLALVESLKYSNADRERFLKMVGDLLRGVLIVTDKEFRFALAESHARLARP
jgi:hypothetical protein